MAADAPVGQSSRDGRGRPGRPDGGPWLGVAVSISGGERYRFTLEASVYVARAAHRRGIGRRLLAALDDAAQVRGVHAIVASIDSENAPSIALFEQFGYVDP